MKIIFTWITVLFAVNSFAQNDSMITGTWKGTSICQVKNSPCHDEMVVYHISKAAGSNSFSILANKIVNNKEEEMGIIAFEYDPQKHVLVSKDTVRNAEWVFKIEGKQIKGTLVYKNKLYRIIDVKKQD